MLASQVAEENQQAVAEIALMLGRVYATLRAHVVDSFADLIWDILGLTGVCLHGVVCRVSVNHSNN